MDAGFGKKTHFKIPNSVCISVTVVQTLRFNTVRFFHLKSQKAEKALESQEYACSQGHGSFRGLGQLLAVIYKSIFEYKICDSTQRI